jgi:polyphenol oxidase
MGPCIGPKAFEVGQDVRDAFVQTASNAAERQALERCFKPHAVGKHWADLPVLARLRLQAAGVQAVYGNDSTDAWCTAGQPSVYFSHRRDAALRGGDVRSTGRMAACIWRV